MTRLFTPDEANLALEHVRPVAEEMVRHSRELAQAQIRQAELVARIAGNGGDITPGEVRDAAEHAFQDQATPAYNAVVQRYNSAVETYNGSCAAAVFDPIVLAQVQHALYCPR